MKSSTRVPNRNVFARFDNRGARYASEMHLRFVIASGTMLVVLASAACSSSADGGVLGSDPGDGSSGKNLGGSAGAGGNSPNSTAGAGGNSPNAGTGGGVPNSAGRAGGGEATGGASTVTPVNPLGRARCRPSPGTNGSPRTVEAAIQLLNGLPKPTNVACFVESLDRPLAIVATSSTSSAQPALSKRSPRVFIRLEPLWLSIVIDGDSSLLVEFGQITENSAAGAPLRSLKGELKLPLTENVLPSASYDRVRFGQATVCSACHTNEQRALGSSSAAFTSTAFRPRPETRVAVDALRLEDTACNWASEPHRCEMLSALFQGGRVDEVEFPSTMSTFF